METLIQSLKTLPTEQWRLAGGKAATLARLAQAGYPVPDGFVILPAAFAGEGLLPEAWKQVQAYVENMRTGHQAITFAVRSSALHEDSAQASFAGAFETVLDVRTDSAIREAIHIVRASRHNARVQAYSQAQSITTANDIAIVVQRMMRAEISGVLFTADPVTGNRARIIANVVHGTGEQLVSGEVTPDTLVWKRPKGEYEGPLELKPFASQLYRLACRLEKELGGPQDIEWAIAGGKIYLLQSRPITTLQGHNPATGEWNDSLTGDYLWTNGNLGEAVPDVMTPCTWSLVQIFMARTLPQLFIYGYPPIGNIGGRFYMNLSLAYTMGAMFRMGRKRFTEINQEVFGQVPHELEIPLIPVSRWSALRVLVPTAVRLFRRVSTNQKKLPVFFATAPARCEALRARIQAASSTADLINLWQADLEPYFYECCQMLEAGARRDGNALILTRRKLRKLIGETDANALLFSGLSASASQLASLGPLLGLTQLARGEIDRATFARLYGHRGPHEFEVSTPRSAEDPDWIDQQLAGLREAPVDATTLLARQKAAQAAAWDRFRQRYPHQAAAMRRRIDRASAAARDREAARSEVIRAFWALRAFVLRAGELTGQGEGLFFLTIDEILAVLGGDKASLASLPARRATYERYCVLPPYPTLICGRFDPFKWAADPQRRSDVFDEHGTSALASDAITGFPGAPGVVEGRTRVIVMAEEADQLQAGEILVTTVTNVGWTPLFPRAAAIVTDVGAPLSHAAIVARELGIPAVVGCGNATMRLHTGDWVRVNGGQGTVEMLRAADAV